MKALRIFLVITFVGTRSAGLAEESPKDIVCEGSYLGHLQGIAHDGNFFYWSHTVTLVKTDQQGQALIQVEVPSHHGDLTAVEMNSMLLSSWVCSISLRGNQNHGSICMIPTP